MLAQQIFPGMRRMRHRRQVFDMQDGVTSHTPRTNVVYLNQYFHNVGLESLDRHIDWLSRTSDLSPSDFLFGDFFMHVCIRIPAMQTENRRYR
ncbi:hypothetical protein Zmor_006507 [Zophobas morio]|uniref:Uncharacterized protein n=1 Tax=Zophobas morio TaxID=2755281 RepID=A0AA38IW38_9CUCU|nr:hypothetical protein Zmor_006507 [Zophobas morio]